MPLDQHYPLLDNLQIYLSRDGQLIHKYNLGADYPFSNRPTTHGNFVIPAQVNFLPLEIMIRVKTDSSVEIPITLWERNAFIENVYSESIVKGLFYGAVIIIGLYNLLIFLTSRDIGFLYTGIYALGLAMVEASLHGVIFAFLWPSTSAWNDSFIIIGISLTLIFAFLFIDQVLRVKQSSYLLSSILKVLVLPSILLIPMSLLLPYKMVIVPTLLLVLLGAPVAMISIILRAWHGYTPAVYSLAGALIFNLFVASTIFVKIGYFPLNAFTGNLLYVGTIIQFLLFSLALAERINIDRRLKIVAQEETANTQQKLLNMQLQINEELERKVRERTCSLETANAKLKLLSTTDPLTGVYNRRFFDKTFAEEFSRAFRDRLPISILLLDIDHFKSLNDNYGHLFGDFCLVETAKIIRKLIYRPSDVVARYGGEEFVIILQDTSLSGAVIVAEKLRKTIASHTLVNQDKSVNITASIGISATVPDKEDAHEILLKSADAQLYHAKECGRNRIAGTGEVSSRC